jgi:hypothetical protein
VWSWRPKVRRQVGDDAAHRADDGGKRDGSPRRARISRKTIAREGRLSPPVPVVFALAHLLLRGSPGCMRPPGLPYALRLLERVTDDAKLGRKASRECGGVSAIFAWPILRDAASRLLRMRASQVTQCQTLMVRRRASAVSNHAGPNVDRAVRKLNRDASTPSSWRKPGPITPGLRSREERLPPHFIDRFRGMGPGFRQDDGGGAAWPLYSRGPANPTSSP